MLYSSIKPADEFLLSPYAFPKKLQFSNYAEVLSKLEYRRTKEGVGLVVYGLGDMFLYSIVWSVATPLIANSPSISASSASTGENPYERND